MAWFFKKENRAEQNSEADSVSQNILLSALLGQGQLVKSEALNIPTVRSCINFIADTVSMLPIKLYQEKDDKVTEIKKDNRVRLLNDDTGDTLDAVQFWRAMITDYFLGKGGYAYVNRRKNGFIGLHYVDELSISINKNADPIFKDYNILVNGSTYQPYEFIKILRNSKDGASGSSIIKENSLILSVAYNSLIYEETLVKKGGNKKGFVKAQKKLTEEAMDKLKAAWRKLYSNSSENVVILNDGLDFQESSNTSVEMQLNENKAANSAEICKLFNVFVNVVGGKAKDTEYASCFKVGVMPILRVIESALNRDLLLEKEKGSFYFAFDNKELLKGDLKARFEAYKTGIEANFLQIDEVRFMEDLPSLDLNWIKLGLDSVLYDVSTKTIYTPNTNQTSDMTTSVIVEENRSFPLDNSPKVIAADFDGTLVCNMYPKIGEIKKDVLEFIKNRKSLGDTIILCTCREAELLQDAIEFCAKNGLDFDFVNENTTSNIEKYGNDCRKIYADIYLDDKNSLISDVRKRKGGETIENRDTK